MLHTVNHFRAFIDDPWVFAKVAVDHALSDIYAMGGTPVTALTVMTLPFATPAKTRELLELLLRGAMEQLAADDVALIGGHTGEGMELSLGFAVNGLADRGAPLHKSGLQTDDALILTKALGTGALFAADMQAKAKGAWIDAAIESMLQSNRDAARLLTEGGATAMTDITGFGLAGHLNEMLIASNKGATLEPGEVPALPGLRDVLSEGIRSTLHEGNARSVEIPDTGDWRSAMLVDPQTSGGLLAGVPADGAYDRRASCTAPAMTRLVSSAASRRTRGMVIS
ncbi:MAG: selenide, water dikinase SelD [Gammaproteobacteria bacterium]|nr:selenide, water dikinase SelD [Gammaproteobacteria bacterium]